MKRYFHFLVIALTIFCFSNLAKADEVFIANYSSNQEVPRNFSNATGTGIVTLGDDLDTLTVDITFDGLEGGNAAAAHIHCCSPRGANSPVRLDFEELFPQATSGTFLATFSLSTDLRPTITPADFIAGLRSGQAYLNIHNATYPGGEIRGQLTAVPEPATMLLLGTGLAGIGAAIKKRRK